MSPLWRREPYRLFFPWAVVLGSVGIGHWLGYTTGLAASYSCVLHGTIQMQAFMMAFAVGFLLTAIPRRTNAAPAAPWEIAAALSLLGGVAGAALFERQALAQLSYALLFLLVLQFAVRRFRGGGAARRRPPAAFVLIPIGVLAGLAGAGLLAVSESPAGAAGPGGALGRLLVEQGVFLCFAVGVGNLVLPLMAGAPPPADLGATPAERRRALGFAVAGLTIVASLILEAAGWSRGGPALRAVVVVLGLAVGAGAWRPPGRPGLHRRLVWLSVWLMPIGLLGAALWPDYRVPALHVLFIGGFSLMAFGVATHVVLSHAGPEHLALGRPPAIAFVGGALIVAMLARVTADWSDTYFAHLGWAAATWLAGAGVWLAFIGPKVLRAPSASAAPGPASPPRIGA